MVNAAYSMASREPVVEPTPDDGVAQGFAVFAGVLMIMAGAWQALVGLGALINNNIYVKTPDYLYQVNITGWAWIHLIVALVVLLAGFGVLSGQTWARVVGIIVVSISALANFMFLPYYPLWSTLIIALDVIVIWALAAFHPSRA